ncbi:BZ3500_MvSof-1268-A1-R1_Chr10-1g02698 [Microbotryum saponariae]|uniref:BZ3500_MvSof-1268-A1-R1_Chr10-1g02698 protein n=1 Tax=Microbotryum saponariae TaxID=289078 RepID=A0A2X0L8V0_9BASI|nr:BZ3500_MvSof-1268-A1-R1_Chr10-1g02698 [Microbotryum saponariae]SDA06187.1 BZ3501_MvSof-1269-A2-R1_Chr10-1g02299 [Microbotryum saponariae]
MEPRRRHSLRSAPPTPSTIDDRSSDGDADRDDVWSHNTGGAGTGDGASGVATARAERLVTLPDLEARLETERAIADGAEQFLHMLETQQAPSSPAPGSDGSSSPPRPLEGLGAGQEELKAQVEAELLAARQRIQELLSLIEAFPRGGGGEQDTSAMPPSPALSEPYPNDALPSLPPHQPTDSFLPTFEMVVHLLQRLDETQQVSDKLRAMDSIVDALKSEVRVKFELKMEDYLATIMEGLGEDAGKHVRAGSYRLLRHLIVDQHDVYQLHACFLDMFLVKSLSRDSRAEVEKEQALRLIRLLLSLPDTDQPVQPAVIRAIVAIAENQEEKLRLACLETLGELLIRDVSLLVAAEGLPVVLQSLSDGPHDLSPFVSMGLLWVLDKPDTRQYFRQGVDLEILLAAFTDMPTKGAVFEERVRASSKMIANTLKSWSGVMYFNLNGKRALTSLVASLTTPSAFIRDALLDMLFNVFHIEAPSWYTSTAGSRLSGLKQSRPPTSSANPTDINAPPRQQANLIQHYLAVLLLIFIDAGLIDALVSVAADPRDATTTRKISLLISEILALSNRVLPLSHAVRVQSLPRLFSLASSFDTSDERLAAGSTLLAVDQFNREQARVRQHRPLDGADTLAFLNSEDSVKKVQKRQVETTNLKMGMAIDDATFRNLLLLSRVLDSKEDHTKWDLDTLFELVEGALLSPKRLDEAMRATKFMRRLLSFFHPFSLRFSDMKKDKDSVRWTRLGCALLETMMANPDGVRYLSEDKFLRQIADALGQLDSVRILETSTAFPVATSPPATELLFSKNRVESTLAFGYFEMLGVMTKSSEGTQLLEKMHIFTSFYRISELRSREDLLQLILENVDYARDGHPRVFLSKALTSSQKTKNCGDTIQPVRIFATQHLAKLIQRQGPIAEEWQLQLLLTQLYDPSTEVRELAVRVLDQACRVQQTLETVVQMRPSLDHLGPMGADLLTRFLSTSIGVGYLHEIEFIDRELEDWYAERNLTYVIELELLMAQALRIDELPSSLGASNFDGTPPPHFYGELVKTSEGCAILEDSDHFLMFADYIRDHALEDQDPEILLSLKAALWAVGHIGSTTGGLEFLDGELVIPSIVEIAEDSPVYSMRGTAYFVLGLIASTLEGVEMLEEVGWEGVVTSLGGATSLCVPMDLANFVHTPTWTPPTASSPESLLLQAPSSPYEIELLSALSNLSNHILATKASKTLARLKQKHRSLFSDPGIFYRALEMLANSSYRLAIRRYILDLFDIPIDSIGVLRIMQAGENLQLDDAAGGDVDEADEAGKLTPSTPSVEAGKPRRPRAATPKIHKGVEAILGESKGMDPGDESESDGGEDVGSTSDEGDDVVGGEVGDEKKMIPLQVCAPLLSVRGFLIS